MSNLINSERASHWTNRKSFILSAETLQGFKNANKTMKCKLCGHILKVGDKARWIYANGTPGMVMGNFFVCAACDAEDPYVLYKAKKQFDMALALAKQWDLC